MEREVFEIIMEQIIEVQKIGRNVATSQRRVNENGSYQAANVATSTRILHQTSLKAHGPEIEGDRKTYGLGHEK